VNHGDRPEMNGLIEKEKCYARNRAMGKQPPLPTLRLWIVNKKGQALRTKKERGESRYIEG